MRGLAAGDIGKAHASEGGRYKKKKRPDFSPGAFSLLDLLKTTKSLTGGDEFVGKDGGETTRFILIVQHHDRNYAQIFLAGVALRHFALQVLQEAVGEAIKSALAAGIFLVALAAVGTHELDLVLLRIAVQSSPSGAAHPDGLGIMPFHGKASLKLAV
jgi:hypothetical protein